MQPARVLCLLAVAGAPAPLAQDGQPPTRKIGSAEAELGEPFTSVSTLRELRDGRVLVNDPRDKTVQIVDFRAGTSTRIGREGAGPGEYALPQRLLALPGDTTLLYDPPNDRFLFILPDATPGLTVRMADVSPAVPRAIDDRGVLYYEVSGPFTPGAAFQSSLMHVVRHDRAGRRTDTLATLQLPKDLATGARTLPGGMLRRFTNKPLAPQDVFAVAPDGRVAVVRAKDYRVEWIGTDGKKTLGPPTAYRAIRITPAEREAFLASQTSPGSIITRGPVAAGTVTVAPGAPRAAPIPRGGGIEDMPVSWPDEKPPFLSGAAVVAPDGRLWVLKTRAHNDPVPVYDVFDRAGLLVERIVLPPRTRLAGFGKTMVYLVRTDDDDLQWLGRYRM